MPNLTKSDLLYSLRELVLSLKAEWKTLSKKQNAISREEMIGFRDGVLVPVLEKITILGGNAIRLEKNTDFEDALKMLADIYQSAGEVARFAVYDQQQHLSWTLTSKLSFQYIYVLGALIEKHKNFDALNTLLSYEIEYPNNYPYESAAGRMVHLHAHPFYSSESNEGDLRTYFDESKKIAIENKIFFEWFNQDSEEVLDKLVRFDFLRGFYLFLNDPERGWTYHNFRRFYSFRVFPTIRNLVTNSNYKKIYGNGIKERLIEFLNTVDKTRGEFSDGWGFGDWTKIAELQKDNSNNND